MTETLPLAIMPKPEPEDEIRALAKRYKAANSVGMQLLNIVGGQAENLLEKLPDSVKDRLETVAERALTSALSAANRSRGVVPDQKGWLNTAITTAMGAAGGVGGLPSAMAEMPITVTVLMRAMLAIAAEHGFDPDSPEVMKECLAVFASAGPLSDDDGADLGFLAARVSITGASVNTLIAKVAPKVATTLGQKLAAQTIPVLGAAAGAAVNYAYTSYYQDMARVHFGLLRLAEDSGLPRADLLEALRAEIEPKRIQRN
ncbi:EcsC family protein [Sagittula salina]|uniref:EcsC family protein n=1 Tax=Sagittula salina TaxID=2820268 RepID=A0A940MGW9_9RHOB|nr:EcsC family protein [Sagittula salina]MBP0481301.1 EcsC family protein [Sagittula salina]